MARKPPPGKKAKVVIPKPQSYGVYFDESARIEPNSGKSQYVFTAALLRDHRKNELEEKYLKLRREMTETCLKIAPQLERHKSIRDGLLEIHAVDLYQSKGIYNLINKIRPGFWKEQHEWIRLALQYAAESNIRYFAFPTHTDEYLRLTKNLRLSVVRDNTIIRHESVREKMSSLANNPYFLALPYLMRDLDHYLRSVGGTSKVYCHTNEETVGFSQIESFSTINKRGHMSTLMRPEFKTCSEEQAIQAADVAGYMILQLEYSKNFNTPLKPEFKRWYTDYVLQKIDTNLYDYEDVSGLLIGTLVFETLMISAKGPPEFVKEVGNSMPLILEFLVDLAITDRDTLLKMYKPPSEDGDLSDPSLST